MNELNKNIEKDFIRAYKEKNEAEILTLRMLKSAIKNASIQKMGELADDEIIKVVRSEIKKRNESAEAFLQGKREDLAGKEKAEIEILEKYLPKQIPDSKIMEIIGEVIEQTKASGQRDFGKVMGMSVKKLAGAAEGGRIAELVKKQLSEKEK